MVGKNNFHANLPILDGKNWDTWVKQMKVIFSVQEVDEQVNNVLDPLPANPTEDQRTTFRDAKRKDNKALFLIHQCVDAMVIVESNLDEQEKVEKVLGTLTSKFDHIVVTIEETKDSSEVKIGDLQSTLEAHELKHGKRNHGKEDEQAL
ncbi:hypothetical protein L195_g035187, partial [Trifolium pratense]